MKKLALFIGLVGTSLMAGELTLTEARDEKSAAHEIVGAMEDSRLASHQSGTIEDFFRGTLVDGTRNFSGAATVTIRDVAYKTTTVEHIGGCWKLAFGGKPAEELFDYLLGTPTTQRGPGKVSGQYITCARQTAGEQCTLVFCSTTPPAFRQ